MILVISSNINCLSIKQIASENFVKMKHRIGII